MHRLKKQGSSLDFQGSTKTSFLNCSYVKNCQIAAIAISCGIQMKIHMFYFSSACNFKQNSSLKNRPSVQTAILGLGKC